MPNRTIYVRKGDETFWDRAEKIAGQRSGGMSSWLSGLVREAVLSHEVGRPIYGEKKVDAELEVTVQKIREVITDFRKPAEDDEETV